MKYLLLVAVMFLVARVDVLAEDDGRADSMLQKLLAAQVARNYDAFVADGTVTLKAALSKTQFEASSTVLIPKLAQGYDIIPMGELNQHGLNIYLYTLRLKTGGDDILAILDLKGGKVAGISFKQ